VANFLRFCQTESEKEKFFLGFDKAVVFWNHYWNAMSEIIDREALV